MSVFYLSTHVVLQFESTNEDEVFSHLNEHTELVDVRHYCSDWCAQTDPDYDGWFGAQELEVYGDSWTCPNCRETFRPE